MRSTIAARRQSVTPASIRTRLSLGPSQRLERIVEAFRGMGRRGGSSQRLLADREAERCFACFLSRMVVLYRVWKDEGERAASIAAATQEVGATLLHKDPEFRAIVDLPQEWLG